jgi:hypothetical protein
LERTYLFPPFPLAAHKSAAKTRRDAIESLVGTAEFNAQIDLEMEDARIVEAYRRTVFEAIGGSLYG